MLVVALVFPVVALIGLLLMQRLEAALLPGSSASRSRAFTTNEARRLRPSWEEASPAPDYSSSSPRSSRARIG